MHFCFSIIYYLLLNLIFLKLKLDLTSGSSFKLAIVSLYCCCCPIFKSCLTHCNTQTVAYQILTHQTFLSFSISMSLLKLISIESVMPSNHFILCHFLFLLPSIFLSIRVFSKELTLHIRWPKYCSFSLSISPFSEY